jgi:predicted  nucleic acid-binding Zn-ribbon protein
MQATPEQIQALFDIQDIERQARELRSTIEKLPQRPKIAEVRDKRDQLKNKKRQLLGMRKDLESDIEQLKAQDEKEHAREVAAQHEIDQAEGDYRLVSSRTAVLQEHAQKRAEIAASIDEKETRILQITDLEEKVDAAIKPLEDKEAEMVEQYRNEGQRLMGELKSLMDKREAAAQTLGKDLLAHYEKVARNKQGVALAKLEDGRCGTCHTPIDHDRLLAMKREAPLSTCPHCGRIVVI